MLLVLFILHILDFLLMIRILLMRCIILTRITLIATLVILILLIRIIHVKPLQSRVVLLGPFVLLATCDFPLATCYLKCEA